MKIAFFFVGGFSFYLFDELLISKKLSEGALYFDAGIMFQDITTLLLDPKAFKDTIDLFVERYKSKNISVVAGDFHIRITIFFDFF